MFDPHGFGFQDELIKEGAHPAFQIARQAISRGAQALRPKDAISAGGVALRGLRGVGSSLRQGGQVTGRALSNFGKRQLHGVTGWTPKGGVESIGIAGSKASKASLDAAKGSKVVPGKSRVVQKALHGRQAGTHGLAKKVRERSIQRAQKFDEATRASERMGLSSIPGWTAAMLRDPKAALKAGLGREWHSGGMGKAMLAFPAVAAGHQALKPTEPGGPGKLERVGRSVGEVAWGMGMPIAPAMIAAKGISEAGGGIGRVLGRLRRPDEPAPKGSVS